MWISNVLWGFYKSLNFLSSALSILYYEMYFVWE